MMFNVKKIGHIKPRKSTEIKNSIFGIGLEKLDRNMYDPTNVYALLNEAGVKYARIQSGWARTEKEKGIYDFSWLDEIVDGLLENGIEPWICLCYGNGLYTPRANDYFFGVGCPPINSEDEMLGWTEYCKAVALHYQGKVSKYEIWNEPDGDWCWINGQNPVEYGNFAIETSKALRDARTDVYIIAGATAFLNPDWIDKMLSTGLNEYIDAVSYHRYTAHLEEGVLALVPPYRDVLNKYGVKDLIQGESGCQSEPFGNGALWEGAWNEEKQVKILLRRELIDFITDVKFCSYFSSVDVDEALIGVTGKAYFGILKNNYDENGCLTNKYTKKTSFYAMQSVCSALAGVKKTDINIEYTPSWSLRYYRIDEDGKDFVSAFVQAPNGAIGFCYYKPTDIMTTSFESTFSCKISNVQDTPRLVDLKDGTVYEFEKDSIGVENGICNLKNIPVKDYPLLLIFGDFAEIDYGN